MKLRNKKTRGIVEAHEIDLVDNYVYLRIFRAGDYDTKQYNSLVELNEEWEDYKEPRRYWSIDSYIYEVTSTEEGFNEDRDNFNKQIGNYFESEEEAESAVEKLEAWTRLKDKGFRFDGWEWNINDQTVTIRLESSQFEEIISGELKRDLELLFGGK